MTLMEYHTDKKQLLTKHHYKTSRARMCWCAHDEPHSLKTTLLLVSIKSGYDAPYVVKL